MALYRITITNATGAVKDTPEVVYGVDGTLETALRDIFQDDKALTKCTITKAGGTEVLVRTLISAVLEQDLTVISGATSFTLKFI